MKILKSIAAFALVAGLMIGAAALIVFLPP